MTALTDHIASIVPLTLAERAKVEAAFLPQHLPKGDFWITEGKVCRHIAYVASGQMRVLYYDDLGEEVTCYFVTADSFISSYTSFLTKAPSTEYIVAMEDTLLYAIEAEALEALSEEVPKIQIFRRIMAENIYIRMERRVAMLQTKTAYERYMAMLEENPDIILNVPLQYTASFLGISPQHLSRLRKGMLMNRAS